MNVIVERYDDAGLFRESWGFWFHEKDMTLYLDEYSTAHRKTRRHGFKREKVYYRTDQRRNNIGIDDVPWSNDVTLQAINELKDSIQIKKTYRY